MQIDYHWLFQMANKIKIKMKKLRLFHGRIKEKDNHMNPKTDVMISLAVAMGVNCIPLKR
jgi:hypothetical protein